ncbi:hypothetical protein ATN88_11545 [Enterovibrio coralii]|uniref:Uncharacterized protein n=1 Tax=Enterovibrio coralii TaxID=294935 RepID=A0A135I372_9GAMM|nr:hypothetical protein ATN88_11545 [Enterovibrio coralii]
MMTNIFRLTATVLLLLASVTYVVNYFDAIDSFGDGFSQLFSSTVVYSPFVLIPILLITVIADVYRIFVSRSVRHRYLLLWDLAVPLVSMVLTFSVLKDWIDRSGMV